MDWLKCQELFEQIFGCCDLDSMVSGIDGLVNLGMTAEQIQCGLIAGTEEIIAKEKDAHEIVKMIWCAFRYVTVVKAVA